VIGFTVGLTAGAIPTEAWARESGSDIRLMLSQYCFECHDNDLAEGRINLEDL
jgi:hypothetical protein